MEMDDGLGLGQPAKLFEASASVTLAAHGS